MYSRYLKMLLKKLKRDLKDINKFIKEEETKAKEEREINIIKELYKDMTLTKFAIKELERQIKKVENGEIIKNEV